MEKRFQVFVSSTYTDLKEERQKVMQALMQMDCIPAGMEFFGAIDDEQFAFIKKVIDDCDYYVLIIGGRYGSLSEDGLSFTEKEFNYALEKGMKVCVFLHGEPGKLTVEKSERNPESLIKLQAFRDRVGKAGSGRMIDFFTKSDELPGKVALSLMRTTKMFPTAGWVRGNTVLSSNDFEEIDKIRKENRLLKDIIKQFTLNPDKIVYFSGDFEICKKDKSVETTTWSSAVSYRKIMLSIYNLIEKRTTESHIMWQIHETAFGNSNYEEKLRNIEYIDLGVEKDYESIQEVRLTLNILGIIDFEFNRDGEPCWKFTKSGREFAISTLSTQR